MRLSVAGDTNMGSGAWDGRLRGELTTIIVRSVLVTVLNLDLGRWMWWPSRLAHKPDPAPAEFGRERATALTAG